MTLSEVAAALTAEGDPITKDGVYNIERAALRKLRAVLESRGFTPDDVIQARERELLPIPTINFAGEE